MKLLLALLSWIFSLNESTISLSLKLVTKGVGIVFKLSNTGGEVSLSPPVKSVCWAQLNNNKTTK
jgi:hypothetical protein